MSLAVTSRWERESYICPTRGETCKHSYHYKDGKDDEDDDDGEDDEDGEDAEDAEDGEDGEDGKDGEDDDDGEDDEDGAEGDYEDSYHFKDKDDSYVQLVKPREHK